MSKNSYSCLLNVQKLLRLQKYCFFLTYASPRAIFLNFFDISCIYFSFLYAQTDTFLYAQTDTSPHGAHLRLFPEILSWINKRLRSLMSDRIRQNILHFGDIFVAFFSIV